MIAQVTDYAHLKKRFASSFREVLSNDIRFRNFIYEVLVEGTAYVIGGYLRDLILNQPSRDLDIMVDLPSDKIRTLIDKSTLDYSVNRLNGIKISLSNFDIDLWSIEHNWAFEKKLIHQNDEYILESIANGCFYNYDALVINVHSNNLFVKHFNEMAKTNTLDILRKNTLYKQLNPTIEANILRAFYLRRKYDLNYSPNCIEYLNSRIGHLSDKYGSAFERLKEYKLRYHKYAALLTDETIKDLIAYCKGASGQVKLF